MEEDKETQIVNSVINQAALKIGELTLTIFEKDARIKQLEDENLRLKTQIDVMYIQNQEVNENE